MKRCLNFLFILVILLALPLTVLAAPVGKLTAVEGNVDITAGGKAREAKPGDAVAAGDILRAKSKSRAEVTFLDGNILRLAEGTRIRITDYQRGEGKTSTIDLFRGKTQNIVAGLGKNAKYEVRTPTSIVGVRGTNFIAFFLNGISGFIPKEGTIYGFNRTMPRDIKIVTPGQAIMVFAPDKPPVVQPATSADVEKHLKDTTPGEKKDEKEKKEDGPASATTPPPPPPVPTTVPLAIPVTVVTTVQTTTTTTVATTVPPTVSGPITGGAITKMVTGTIRQSQYASLYRMPAGTIPHGEFYSANGTDYLRVRYEDMYFDDGISVNRGYRFEQSHYIPRASQDVWTQERQTWYWPNQFFVSFNHDGNGEGVRNRGRTYDLFPNLDLSAPPTNGGGASGTHPLFTGTVGSAAGFPADYAVGSPGTGTFVRTIDWTLADVNSREQVGQFTGTLGVVGSNPMTLWASSSAADPARMALKGAFTHDAGYEGPAFSGTVGYYGTIDKYVETAPGHGGAYFGQLMGYLPDTGSTLPMKGTLYALYIYNPDPTTNKAGVITGRLTPGAGTTAFPATGTWQAEGTINRLTGLEIDNTSGTTAATLAATVVSGRAGVEATAGFYNPTGAPGLALGMGHGWIPSISGIDSFGIFFLGHGFINRHENASTNATWETRGWGEFGRYQRTDDPSQNYRDHGYWYADLNGNKSWADNQLSADFNGRFLTLMKYGTMTGGTTGSYNSDGTWGAGSQGYWQKGGDLGFASKIGGNTFHLGSRKDTTYVSGNSRYEYSLTDPRSDLRWGGRSHYYDAAVNRTTIQNFDSYGPAQQRVYVKEIWTTTDGGANWSYAATQYSDEAAWRTAADGMATPPPGEWQETSSKDRYELWNTRFGGIMGGLNANLWTDKTSPLKFQGSHDIMGDGRIVPSLSFSEIVSLNPLATANAFANSELKIGGAYRGMIGAAVDSTNSLRGGLMALYLEKAGGTGGILYSDDIKGVLHPQVQAWEADGTLNVYPLTGPLAIDPKLFAGSVIRTDWTRNYNSGDVPVDVISGGTPPMTGIRQTTTMAIPGQPWSIWNIASGGTAASGTQGPVLWLERRENEPNPRGGYESTYSSISHVAPINGLFTGNVAAAVAKFDETNQTTGKQTSHTVVLGGVIKGLFDPATTPLTWTAISQGSGMETAAFATRQAAMDDAARANFERAMKIPSFDVGMANLRGNDGNLYVNMDGVQFFRFRTETDPRIWATPTVYGSYISDPVAAVAGAAGTRVQLHSSGSLTGLTHTFEVQQWNAGGNNNWGASVYRGANDTGGTLTRSAVDAARTAAGNLPAGAPSAIPITELRGGAAGIIKPGVNATGLPGPNSFGGTAAGTVR